jgi:hypothetical protein
MSKFLSERKGESNLSNYKGELKTPFPDNLKKEKLADLMIVTKEDYILLQRIKKWCGGVRTK